MGERSRVEIARTQCADIRQTIIGLERQLQECKIKADAGIDVSHDVNYLNGLITEYRDQIRRLEDLHPELKK